MRSTFLGTAGLLVLGTVLLGQPTLERADSQSPPDSVQITASHPQPDKNLPADFIDSRPIVAYFDDKPMPDTVRGLLQELKRSDRCGKGANLRPEEACALVFYKLDDDFTPDAFRPPFIMKAIYRITEPENLADTVMTMPDKTGVLKRYTNGDLYEPLRDIRANICRQEKRRFDQCRATENKGILYRPYAILGNTENDREDILPAKSAHKHFLLNLEPPNVDELKDQQLRDLCRLTMPPGQCGSR